MVYTRSMRKSLNGLVKGISSENTGDTLFNPYNEFCRSVDTNTAPGIRQQNLRIYLQAHKKQGTQILWVYLNPTRTEFTRSGVPLVNSSQFNKIEELLDSKKRFEKATKTKRKPKKTIISTTLLDVAQGQNRSPLVWPVVPFYPHSKTSFNRSRKPTSTEIKEYSKYLLQIIEMYEPRRIYAIGNESKEILDSLNVKSTILPHPRRGLDKFKKALNE